MILPDRRDYSGGSNHRPAIDVCVFLWGRPSAARGVRFPNLQMACADTQGFAAGRALPAPTFVTKYKTGERRWPFPGGWMEYITLRR